MQQKIIKGTKNLSTLPDLVGQVDDVLRENKMLVKMIHHPTSVPQRLNQHILAQYFSKRFRNHKLLIHSFICISGPPLTSCLMIIQSYNRHSPKGTYDLSSKLWLLYSPLSHVITLPAFGNWLTFRTGYSILWSHNCNLWLFFFLLVSSHFCQKEKKKLIWGNDHVVHLMTVVTQHKNSRKIEWDMSCPA